MSSPAKRELLARIMESRADNDAGWFDRLFAFLMAERLANEVTLSISVVAEVFDEARRRGSAITSPRDALDIEDLHKALAPKIGQLKALSELRRYEEIFRLIYTH